MLSLASGALRSPRIHPANRNWSDARDVYGVASRVFFTNVLGEGTQLSQVTYGDLLSQRRGWRCVLLILFQRFVREGRVT